MVHVQVTDKGEIPIPASIRKKHRIKPGTRMAITERGGELVLTVDPKAAVAEVAGLLKGHGSGVKELLKQRAYDRRKEDAKANTRRSR
jgi:AbrB family looped-hinge helix DNA binding protein